MLVELSSSIIVQFMNYSFMVREKKGKKKRN